MQPLTGHLYRGPYLDCQIDSSRVKAGKMMRLLKAWEILPISRLYPDFHENKVFLPKKMSQLPHCPGDNNMFH